jgi:hypothetical protein
MKSHKPDSEIERLRKRIDEWRRTRSGRSPMPKALWREATRLVPERGVSRVATSLGLGYYALQERARRDASSSGTPGFVELSAAQVGGLSPAGPPSTVIEVRAPDGAQLTLRLAPGVSFDLADLVHRFRGGES